MHAPRGDPRYEAQRKTPDLSIIHGQNEIFSSEITLKDNLSLDQEFKELVVPLASRKVNDRQVITEF